jgi:hypothetical protein
LLDGGRRRKQIREKENAERHAKRRAEQAADQEDENAAPKSSHHVLWRMI